MARFESTKILQVLRIVAKRFFVFTFFKKAYNSSDLIISDLILLLGSAEGHGVPRKLIYASVLMHEMCYATEKMRIGPSDSHYRM